MRRALNPQKSEPQHVSAGVQARGGACARGAPHLAVSRQRGVRLERARAAAAAAAAGGHRLVERPPRVRSRALQRPQLRGAFRPGRAGQGAGERDWEEALAAAAAGERGWGEGLGERACVRESGRVEECAADQ
jgi:hypothetical protein